MKMEQNRQAVIFDLYGTLIYLTAETKPYHKLFLELGLTIEEIREARIIALTEDFKDLSGFVNRIKPETRIALQQYEEEVAKEVASAKTYPETIKVLERLKERNMKLGLISNLASPYKKPFYDLGLHLYFDNILFSCAAGLKKPDLRIYQKILEEMVIEPFQALMIGDKEHCDVDPPKAIGMNAILLDRNNQSPSPTKICTLEGIFPYC